MRVGFVGLGNMGLPMARRVISTHELHIYTRDPAKADALTAAELRTATVVPSVETLAASVDVLVTSLTSVAASEEVLLTRALPHARRGAVLVDCGTVTQQLSVRCAAACAEVGVHFVDAPVSGGPARAADGTLSIMAGCSDEALQIVQPVLECMGRVYHMGGPGTGTAAKLVNQLLVGVHSMAACEGLLMAQKLGIEDTTQLMELLRASFGYSKVLDRNAPAIFEANWSETNQPIRNMVKDMAIVSEVMQSHNLALPVTDAAVQLHKAAEGAALLSHDMAVPYQLLLDEANHAASSKTQSS